MANLTLAPEEDDPNASSNISSRVATGMRVDDPMTFSGMQRLHSRFDPSKVGFGIVAPWLISEQARRTKDGGRGLPTEVGLDGKTRDFNVRKEQE